ncbi:hypothetical protein [Filifactor villosus]|uniref:Uncharacterized protein n=1 Tax=Filifactor villosus TaxID=29374 RepID=A0ABV9QR47_9FIRM
MRLIYGKRYRIRRRDTDEINKQKQVEVMTFVGNVDDRLLLFRHPIGYKEAFLKRLAGVDYFIEEVSDSFQDDFREGMK